MSIPDHLIVETKMVYSVANSLKLHHESVKLNDDSEMVGPFRTV